MVDSPLCHLCVSCHSASTPGGVIRFIIIFLQLSLRCSTQCLPRSTTDAAKLVRWSACEAHTFETCRSGPWRARERRKRPNYVGLTMPASCARSLGERRARGCGYRSKRGCLFSPGGLVTARTREPAGSAQPRTAPGRARKGRWVSVGGRTRQLRKLGVPHAASEDISPRGH